MSHWISVYCQSPVTRFSASVLEQEIRRGCVDYTGHDYFDDYFSFVKVRKYVSPTRHPESSLFHVTYKLHGACKRKLTKQRAAAMDGEIPIVLDHVVEPDVVAGMVREQLEDCLRGRRGPKAVVVRSHLAKVVEIYSFSMKAAHREEPGRIVVSSARQFLAREGNGLVLEDGIGWMQWTRHGLFEVLKE